MKYARFSVAVMAISGVLALPAIAAPKKHQPVTVTGCLSQGDEANEFSIKDANGKTYGLFSSHGVDFKSHLNHKVTVTGTPTAEHEGKGREKHEAKTATPEESEHLRVTNLTMVSTSCP